MAARSTTRSFGDFRITTRLQGTRFRWLDVTLLRRFVEKIHTLAPGIIWPGDVHRADGGDVPLQNKPNAPSGYHWESGCVLCSAVSPPRPIIECSALTVAWSRLASCAAATGAGRIAPMRKYGFLSVRPLTGNVLTAE